MELTWDDEDVLKLIHFYELRPCLWNITLMEYRNKDMKRAMEKELAENLHRTGMWKTTFNQLGIIDNLRIATRASLSHGALIPSNT